MKRAQLPRILSNDDDYDEENHSVFDFPSPLGDVEEEYDDGIGKKNKRTKKSLRRGKDAPSSHSYPPSISIQIGQTLSPVSNKKEMRSPVASPGERGVAKRGGKELRQLNSPGMINKSEGGNSRNLRDGSTSEVSIQYRTGRAHFLRNQLSEAVDAYSRAIRSGLEDLKHRKGMVHRITSSRNNNADREEDVSDAMTIELGETIATIHLDMGRALEVAGKYADAGKEFENGMRMLRHTCHVKESNQQLKHSLKDMKRMERASGAK